MWPDQEVKAAITAAQSFLPQTFQYHLGTGKSNPADAPVLTLAITSGLFAFQRVEDLADSRLAPKILAAEWSWTGDPRWRPKARSAR